MSDDVVIHRFECAGLGAYDQFLGVDRIAFKAAPDAPEQPGGCCDLCGTGIIYQYHFKSANGRTFKLDSDCALTQFALMLRDCRLDEFHQLIEQARTVWPTVRHTFEADPHPTPFFADQGKTLADYIEFCWDAGNAGWAKRILAAVTR